MWQLPPERVTAQPTYPTAIETAEEREIRYRAIAEDIAEVAAKAGKSETMQRRAAAYLVGVGILESAFARDVDLLRCDPERVKKGGCDAGSAKSAWQLRGYDVTSRRHAAELALAAMNRSFRACRHLPAEEQLAVYASGSCRTEAGRRASRIRVQYVRKLEARKELAP